jgi:hypothetical protein
MPLPSTSNTIVDTIKALAEEIARASPESANKAMRIVELVQDLGGSADRASIRDVIEAETLDTDLSDGKVQTTADAVVKALRD